MEPQAVTEMLTVPEMQPDTEPEAVREGMDAVGAMEPPEARAEAVAREEAAEEGLSQEAVGLEVGGVGLAEADTKELLEGEGVLVRTALPLPDMLPLAEPEEEPWGEGED